MDEKLCPYCMGEAVKPDGRCAQCGRPAAAYIPRPHHLPPGWTLAGRYRLGQVLGEGGFGITYLGWDALLEVKVAVKEYFPTGLAGRGAGSPEVVRYADSDGLFEKGRERFLQEARALAKMEKLREIVGVSGYFQENNTAYIVMEFVEGVTLGALAKERSGKLPGKELLPLVEPLLLSLDKMHRLGLIHRDISPDNLMLEDGAVRLLDMGSARELLGKDSSRTATVLLRHSYAPIEQYLGREQGPWTDVYALCATLYHCLTGQPPPTSLDRLAGEKLPPPRELGADVTPQQERALLRGLAVKPRQRFASMEELHGALYGGKKPARPRKKRLRPVLLGAAVAVLLGALAFLLPKFPVPAPAPVQTEKDAGAREPGLQDWLEDNTQDTVTVEAGTRLMVTEPVTITKPVRVEPGAALALAGHALVTGEGRLEIEGELRVETLLQLADGGSARVAEGGVLTVNGYCWREEKGNLAVEEGGEANAPDDTHFLTVDEESLFADAVHVESFAEYREAALRRPSAIVVDGDMEIPGLGETHQVPVLISEGVTVTGAVKGEQASSWNVDGTVLVNRGTLLVDLKMDDWGGRGWPVTILNYGEAQGRGYLQGKGVVLNLGEMTAASLYTWETGLCNVGTFHARRLENEGGINIRMGCTFYNGGLCDAVGADGAPAPIAIEQGCKLFNGGQMEFGELGWLTNEAGAQVVSVGSMRFGDGSQLANPGTFYNAGGTVELPLDENGQVRSSVLIGDLPVEADYWELDG